MTLILMNNRLALEMTDLEIRARKGDPVAIEEFERQCMKASRIHNSSTEQLKRAVKSQNR